MTEPIHYAKAGVWRKRRSTALAQTVPNEPVCDARRWTRYTNEVDQVTCDDCREFLADWEPRLDLVDKDGQP